MSDVFMKTKEVAEFFKISSATVLNWQKKGQLPGGEQFGRNWRFLKSAVEKYAKINRASVAEGEMSDEDLDKEKLRFDKKKAWLVSKYACEVEEGKLLAAEDIPEAKQLNEDRATELEEESDRNKAEANRNSQVKQANKVERESNKVERVKNEEDRATNKTDRGNIVKDRAEVDLHRATVAKEKDKNAKDKVANKEDWQANRNRDRELTTRDKDLTVKWRGIKDNLLKRVKGGTKRWLEEFEI